MSKKTPEQRRHENRERHQANVAANPNEIQIRLPRLWPRVASVQAWLARRSRAVRVLLAVVVATVLTGAIALLLYGVLFQLPPAQLVLGPINGQNILTVTVTALALGGLAIYWVSWRLLVGFDLGAEPLTPGRAAARWVLLGLAVFLITVVAATLALLNALGPV
ncbi:MAG: hypothetical protein IT323_07330 [Anaerolineae bacterium]|nr:hypothetical protein [Anaerolineae bacterium]